MADDEERSEKATAKRREEARKKGQVVQSRELSSAAIILGTIWVLYAMGGLVITNVQEMMIQIWTSFSSTPMTQDAFNRLTQTSVTGTLLIVAPIMAIVGFIGVASTVGQRGFLWTTEPMSPDWSRINPLNGFKRLFSLQVLFELVKTVVKFTAVGGLSYIIIRGEFPAILTTLQGEPRQMLATTGGMLLRLTLWSGFAIVLMGGADYAYQRWEYERKLRMSRQELKEEMRQTEGDPRIRARIRSLQRERARKRMMADVPKADVVVTNPTSLAVALMYRHGETQAPKVVAKGAGFVAQRIREVAKENGIPVMENKPLAQVLFKTVEVGESIPSQFYRAVAEILAYVYRMRGKK